MKNPISITHRENLVFVPLSNSDKQLRLTQRISII
jgi:hypothetical protein